MKNLALTTLLFLSTSTLWAINWTGFENSDWNNPKNWSEAPTEGCDVVINPEYFLGAKEMPFIGQNSTFNIGSMTLKSKAYVLVDAQLNIVKDLNIEYDATMDVSSESFVNIDGKIVDASGSIIVSGELNAKEVEPSFNNLIVHHNGVLTVNNHIATTENKLKIDDFSWKYVPSIPSVKEVTFYPNPTVDHVIIKKSGHIEVKVYNSAGEEKYFSQADDYLMINLTNLAAGNYLIEVISDQGVTREAIVKQ